MSKEVTEALKANEGLNGQLNGDCNPTQQQQSQQQHSATVDVTMHSPAEGAENQANRTNSVSPQPGPSGTQQMAGEPEK